MHTLSIGYNDVSRNSAPFPKQLAQVWRRYSLFQRISHRFSSGRKNQRYAGHFVVDVGEIYLAI
jgi:hypothetical protein